MEITAADFEPVAAWAWEDDNRDYAEEAWQRAEYQRMQEEETEVEYPSREEWEAANNNERSPMPDDPRFSHGKTWSDTLKRYV